MAAECAPDAVFHIVLVSDMGNWGVTTLYLVFTAHIVPTKAIRILSGISAVVFYFGHCFWHILLFAAQYCKHSNVKR
jgi:hypothetical protein